MNSNVSGQEIIRCTNESYAHDFELCEHDVRDKAAVSAGDPDECREKCREDEDCKFWTFYAAAAECRFKGEDALCGQRAAEGAVTGPDKCTKE